MKPKPYTCWRAVWSIVVALILLQSTESGRAATQGKPIRILFLGHDSEHHNSNEYYPMISEALGRDAIYFDYETDVATALGADYLNQFDGLLLYANHERITDEQMKTLLAYVESGHAFLPIHCASACFGHDKRFVDLVGGRFSRHGGEEFTAKITDPDHPAMKDVTEFQSWDETYVHSDHNESGRTVLMKREQEPWTWVRTQGKGRVFYTASGHDQRTWEKVEFQQLLKSGILWSVSSEVRSSYEAFITSRTSLKYVKRDNIPNYERRPEPLPFQLPLSAEESMTYTQVPVEFDLKLFASEPDIINPICLAWDERGRLWVAETVDYPNEIRDSGGRDSIKILEDTDGDGKCDKVTVFADGFNIVTSMVFVDGGLLIAQAPDFIFLQDTDGDDRADVRKVILSGWGKGDTHAGPSNLRYGFDNWVYGTVGYSGFRNTFNGGEKRFAQGMYRMKSDGSDIEFLYQFNNNTWGAGFNAEGDAFGSTANNNPSFFGGIPSTTYPDGMRGMTAKMIASSSTFHPITPNIRQVDVFGGYTAGAGHSFALSDAFPPAYRNTIAFVNGPTGNLTGRYRVERDGAGFAAKNAFAFAASADEWFSPVAAEVGPDGALWIADWYNFIIQHNPTPSGRRGGYDAQNGPGNAHVNPNRDREHGRIYRVVWKDAPASKINSLDGANTETLVAALDNDNQFWRLTAQRLLVQKQDSAAVSALKEKVATGGTAGIHALWTLDGLGSVDRETLQAALLSPDAGLRRNAIKLLGTDHESLQLFFDTAVVTDSDSLVRLAAFNHISKFPTTDALTAAVTKLMKHPDNIGDEWIEQSLKIAASIHGAEVKYVAGPNLIPNASFEKVTASGAAADWRTQTHSGAADYSLDTSVARTGSNSLKIASARGGDAGFFATVPVKPNTQYRLAGWVKTDDVAGAQGALLNVHGMSREDGGTTAVNKTSDWKEVELVFNSSSTSQLQINALFGGWGHSRGTAWYDDLYLGEVTVASGTNDTGAVVGDMANGEKIFRQHPIAACIRCHKVGDEGGVIGPVLDGLAGRKDRAYIFESLVDPSATMAEGFQLLASPMPPMGVLLKDQELEDLMAYLMTLE